MIKHKNIQPTYLGLLTIHILANLFGVALFMFYFANLQGIKSFPLVSDGSRMVLAGFIAFVLFVLGISLGNRWLRPAWNWYQKARSNQPTSSPPGKIQQKALNLPLYIARINLLMWLLAGLLIGSLNIFDPGIGRLELGSFLGVFIGAAFLSGPIATALEYFVVERSWRTIIPLFFVGSDPTRVSAPRLRVRTRVLILFILGTLPLILLSILAYNLIVSDLEPAPLLARLLLLVLTLGGGGVLLAAILARTLTISLVEPLEELAPRLEAVQEGKDVDHISVTSNDELGELASHFNQMVHSLKRREEELNTIYHISREITDNLEIDATLQAVLEQVREIIPYDGGEICLYDKNENVLRVRAWTSSAKVITDTRGRSYTLGEGYTGWVGSERKSLLIPDVDAHEGQKPTVRQIADGVFLNGFLGVPLLAGQKMVGTPEIVSTRKGFFNEHTRQILEIIAPQAAIAIANAEQVIERERNLKAQIEQLKIEIDQVKRNKQVSEITETGFFQKLKEDAQRMRREAREDG